ncbi:MAG: alpha/beta fold hydrolase [Betaproteobacteria bacterium]|nr:alpha/beta fold hydrolase [Betaproteobacteria bacterium]
MQRYIGCRLSGAGPNVVLLHASMSTAAQWKPLAAALERDHTVLAMDLIGYGDAPGPANPTTFSLRREAERVLAYTDACFGAGAPFKLVGHSYGGATALRIAREHPQRVSALVAYEPVCFNLLDEDEDARELALRLALQVSELAAQGRTAQAAALFYDFWNGPDTWRALPVTRRERLAALSLKVALDFQAVFLEPRSAQAYACIDAPALLLGGTRSFRMTRRILGKLAAVMSGARLAWVDGDHMAPAFSPETVNPLIETFLRGEAVAPAYAEAA